MINLHSASYYVRERGNYSCVCVTGGLVRVSDRNVPVVMQWLTGDQGV